MVVKLSRTFGQVRYSNEEEDRVENVLTRPRPFLPVVALKVAETITEVSNFENRNARWPGTAKGQRVVEQYQADGPWRKLRFTRFREAQETAFLKQLGCRGCASASQWSTSLMYTLGQIHAFYRAENGKMGKNFPGVSGRSASLH
jgi:hypothetical protein